MTCGGRSWAGPERGSEILCVLTHGMGSTPPPPPQKRRLTELLNCSDGMFSLAKGLKADSKEVEGGRCVRGSDGKLCFSVKERGKVWKYYMERIMNEQNV